MSVNLIGDIHLGKRFPYTNKKTSDRWEKVKLDTLATIFTLPGKFIQLGDLFDSYSVNHEIFVQGFGVATNCFAVLSGNHDKSNNTEKSSALLDLDKFGVTVVGKYNQRFLDDGTCYLMIPHQPTQELFEAALEDAKKHAEQELFEAALGDSKKHAEQDSVLLLHCNYGDHTGTQTENYLRVDTARDLLNYFRSIHSGHEHQRGCRETGIYMEGAILPMSFGEMEDKGVTTITGSTFTTWKAADHYLKLDVKDFLELPVTTPLQFIEVTGSVDIAQTVELSKRTVQWYMESETLIAIKNGTTAYKTEVDLLEDVKAADWVSRVSALMTDTEYEVFKDLLEIHNAN